MYVYPLIHLGVIALCFSVTVFLFWLTDVSDFFHERSNWMIKVSDWLMVLGTCFICMSCLSLLLFAVTILLIFINGLISVPWWELP